MVDDIISITESNYKSATIYALKNAKIAIKQLLLGAEKYVVLHIGREHEEYKNV